MQFETLINIDMIFIIEKYLSCFKLINIFVLVSSGYLLERERERERDAACFARVQYIEKSSFLKIIPCIFYLLICPVLYLIIQNRVMFPHVINLRVDTYGLNKNKF